jgi:hypothetical protein
MRRLFAGEFVRVCAVGTSGYAVIVVYAALTGTSAPARFSCP